MNCPVCNDVRMREVEKDNILIDICPNCKGVWLDRGELEKITKGLREDQGYYNKSHDSDNRDYRKDNDSEYDKHGNPKKKRKKSIVDILSDFL